MTESPAELPSELDFPAFLMNFPFTVDNRNANNELMDEKDAPYNMERAFSQFMVLYAALAKDSLVYILPSGADYQDLPFVANLGLCPPHKPKVFLLSNFTSPPRKGEDDVGRKFFSLMGYEVIQPPYLWEGEADLKYIRKNLYLGGYGQRSTPKAFNWIAHKVKADIVQVKLRDEKLYHLDCSVFPIDDEKALVATSVFSPEDKAKIEKIVDVVDVPKEFVYEGWTNVVRLGDTILYNGTRGSRQTVALSKLMEKHGLKVEPIPLQEFHKSGADLSCMAMHLNANNRTRKRKDNPLYSRS